MSIHLFKHNQQAYRAVTAMLEKEKMAAVIHPTGTGKSLIAFKLAEENPSKHFLWLSPSEYIYQTQLEKLNMKFPNIQFMSYSRLMKNEDSIETLHLDYIILDEFHRCGAQEWGRSVRKLLDTYPNAKRLGLSATNIRYLDNQRNMAEEIFDGKIASEMTLGEAIVREILPEPKYVIQDFPIISWFRSILRYPTLPSMELRLPDPKVLLRCSTKMPGDLLELALDCMSTGIGAPFLSNDDVVIPALLSFGYLPDDACKYATSACWEPLIIGNSCDQNNVKSINFARPLLEVMDSREFEELKNSNDLLKLYRKYLKRYLSKMLNTLSKLQFEEDPLLSLLSKSSRKKGKDIVRGGADYSNLGLTSVGMGTVVNSILNINKYVFVEKKYTLKQLNEARKTNFRNEQILNDLKNMDSSYGCDNEEVVKLTKMIEKFSSDEFEKHRTGLGGKFKFGLSSPGYISEAKSTAATMDGRRDGEPFSVHISSVMPVAATELLSFAMKLDYNDNRINGNVVDLFATPKTLTDNKEKYLQLLMAAFRGGLYQFQMNVVDSATLIAAKKNPEKFPTLVVRVWGFSAYFKDLPEEYKDLLIKRAIESEKAA